MTLTKAQSPTAAATSYILTITDEEAREVYIPDNEKEHLIRLITNDGVSVSAKLGALSLIATTIEAHQRHKQEEEAGKLWLPE